MSSRDTCWETTGIFGGFFFVGGIWLCGHTLLLCLNPQLFATCTSFTARKVGGRGRSQRFSFVSPLYVIWHWYMLISRFPALEVYGSVFGALTITAVFEWAEQGCKNLLNYSNFFNSFVLSVTSSSSCQNTFCSCNVAQNYIPTNT